MRITDPNRVHAHRGFRSVQMLAAERCCQGGLKDDPGVREQLHAQSRIQSIVRDKLQ